MMCRLLILLFCMMAGPVLSQTVLVRSGAHDGFVRIALDVPDGTEWSLTPREDGALISLVNHNDGFDVSRVFDRIDRTYLSAVSTTPTNLELTFSCRCIATAFAQNTRMIVVDIAEIQNSDAASPSRDVLNNAMKFVGSQSLTFGTEKVDSMSPRANVLRDAQAGQLTEIPQNPIVAVPQREVSSAEATAPRLRSAQEKLVQQIGRAATQGLLKPNQRDIELPFVNSSPQIDVEIFNSSRDRPADASQPDLNVTNLAITSSSDVELREARELAPFTSLGITCIDPDMIAVSSWGAHDSFASQIALLRSQVLSEFDQPNEGIVKKLAQTYLYFGFGAEARQVVELSETDSRVNMVLLSLADIMEYGYEKGSSYLERFADCDSDAALWGILAGKEPSPAATLNSNAALQALSALPLHLRVFIAPELSRRFLFYGDKENSEAALRSMERTAKPLSDSAKLVKADLEIKQGKLEVAGVRLMDVIDSNSAHSAEALVKFVDNQLNSGATVDQRVANLVQAYAIEMRDDPIGIELQRSNILALGKSGQFEEAIDALSILHNGENGKAHRELRSLLMSLVVESAEDTQFLKIIFNELQDFPNKISLEARQLIAYRLVDLGFNQQAEDLLAIDQGMILTPGVSELKAKIALNMSRPREALAHLYGLTSENANQLRAEAELMNGNHIKAHSYFIEKNDLENIQRSAFLSDEWVEIVETNDEVFSELVEISQSASNATNETTATMENAQDAILESENARNTINDLIAADILNQDSGPRASNQ